MTIGCEMNKILLRTLKNHLKRYIFGEKMYYHRSNHRPRSTLVTIVVNKAKKRTTITILGFFSSTEEGGHQKSTYLVFMGSSKNLR